MKYNFSGNLSAEKVDALSEQIGICLENRKVDKHNAIGIRLTAENILLFYQKTLGENVDVRFSCSEPFGRPRMLIRVRGASADPFAEIAEEDYFLRDIMEKENLQPTWNYRFGWNTICFMPPTKRKISSFFILMLSVILGLGLGLFAKNFSPELAVSVSEKWLTPLSSVVMGLLSTLSALMMFFSVISGIYSMGDISTFQRVGKHLIFRMVFSTFMGAVGSLGLCLLFYPLQTGGSSAWNTENLWEMILGVVPTNVVEAFSTGNTMQIMFLAIFIGIILLTLSSGVRAVSDFMVQMDLVAQTMVQGVLSFLPVSVFVSLFNLVVSSDISSLYRSYRYPLFVLICCFTILLVYVLWAAIKFRVSPLLLVKKTLPSSLIAFSTGSSSSTFSTNMDICEHRLGMDPQFVKIGVPLSQATFGITRTSTFVCASFILSCAFGTQLPVTAIVPLIFSSVIYAIAAPTVSGATLSCFILLFDQIGVPVEALAVVVALQPLIDRIVTFHRAIACQCDLACAAAKFGQIDADVLKNPL